MERTSFTYADSARLLTTARAFLSVQATSASVERLFSEAGNSESGNRHSQSAPMLEMLLVIRKWARSRLSFGDLDPADIEETPLQDAGNNFRRLAVKSPPKSTLRGN